MLYGMARSEAGREITEPRRAKYRLPVPGHKMPVSDLLAYTGRAFDQKQMSLFSRADAEPNVYWAGELALLKRPCVSVIGARQASDIGIARASKIARQLVERGVVVTSGLARGVDVAAHLAALRADGRTIAVIGTPLEKAYPAEHGELQAEIAANHLLVSQFSPGQRTFPSDFPKRNRLMAALTDASIIVEASDSSGTLHQATECVRLGRWLFIMQSVLDDKSLEWPHKFVKEPKVVILTAADDVLSRVL